MPNKPIAKMTYNQRQTVLRSMRQRKNRTLYHVTQLLKELRRFTYTFTPALYKTLPPNERQELKYFIELYHNAIQDFEKSTSGEPNGTNQTTR